MAQTIADDRHGAFASMTSELHCHRQGIPNGLAQKIDLHYGALFSSPRQLQLSGKLSDEIWVYQSQPAASSQSIFLFECHGSDIKVLNEQIRAPASDIEQLIEYLFGRHPAVSCIDFFGLDTGKLALRRPYQRFFCAEDIVIPEYGSDLAYADDIGKSTKRNIRRRSAALAEAYPASRFEVIEAGAITPELVERVIAFNRSSMTRKNRTSTYQDDALRLALLAAHEGLAGTVLVDGDIVAGTVCARIGNCFYMLVTGRDFRFDAFSLGMLCCYWTARECFRRGAREINMMGGRLDYKYSLLGRSRKYDALCVYRSRTAMLRHAGRVADMALHGACLEAKFALLDCEREDGAAARLVARGIRAWRSAKARHRQDIA
ncbi:GNAT family N-acetyltransferase [Massilia aerilata]|uniref:GNAT family N-acetyltransferase n=1 Tax=Massilia aerilata TaxID=453817 RepID=A0ABW0RYB4_9BURK